MMTSAVPDPEHGSGIDVISLFAAVVFAGSWYLRARLGADDALARLFFGTLMALAVAIGVLGLLLRTIAGPVP